MIEITTAAIVCLALNVYHEARGEGLREQAAVAHVVLNRVNSARFPDSVCDVVLQGGGAQLHRCQFSWWCDGKRDMPGDPVAWERSLHLAVRVLQGETPDPTGGARWYHSHAVAPRWACTSTYQDDAHKFYNHDRKS